MKKGDMVCSKDKSVVGVVIDLSVPFNDVTIAILWDDSPLEQRCKYVTLHYDNVILLPKGTLIREILYNGKVLKCEYESYDSEEGMIIGKDNHNLIILGGEQYEFIFKDDEVK